MKKPVVYYVDDEDSVLDIARHRISQKEFDLRIFSSPLNALANLPDDRPCLIFSDQRMDEMDGLTFLKIANQFDPEIKLFVITAYKEDWDKILATKYLSGLMAKDQSTHLKIRQALEKLAVSKTVYDTDRQNFLLIFKAKFSAAYKGTKSLKDLVGPTIHRNSKHGISGLMLYNEDLFLQIIEGESHDLLNLYQEIIENDGTKKTKLLWFVQMDDKLFPDLTMLTSEMHPEVFNQCSALLSSKKRDVRLLVKSLGWVVRRAEEQNSQN